MTTSTEERTVISETTDIEEADDCFGCNAPLGPGHVCGPITDAERQAAAERNAEIEEIPLLTDGPDGLEWEYRDAIERDEEGKEVGVS
jgi:hypothetical protein